MHVITTPIEPSQIPNLSELMGIFAKERGTDPEKLVDHLTVPAGRTLLTGHVMGLRKYGKLTAESEDVVVSTALRFYELLRWGETSPAFVIANMDDVPLQTIHSRIRLAKKRGILQSPGTPVRRQPQEQKTSSEVKAAMRKAATTPSASEPENSTSAATVSL
jgi:hypothetical protein